MGRAPMWRRVLGTTWALLVLAAAPVAAQPAPATPRPVVFVHGIGGSASDWRPVVQRLARGRPIVDNVAAGDSDAWVTGSLAPDALVVVDYYREDASSPRYYTDRLPDLPSIGGCPVPRTDRHAGAYRISYAAQLARIVENVCRATGSEQVDLAAFSMGGLVARSYTRWLSRTGPQGASRVRRLLTVATPNHGINSFEALFVALAYNGVRAFAKQGEAAELNRDCRYWSGRSFIDHLNDGWDAFCQREGIVYAAGVGSGQAIQHQNWARAALQFVLPILRPFIGYLLPHPNPSFNLNAQIAEASGDGDGAVRTDSARFDPALYPSVRFNAPFHGTHTDYRKPERSLQESTWCEALVLRFIFEGRSGGGFLATLARAEVVNAGFERSWIAVELDLAGEPLAASVTLRSGLGTLAKRLVGPAAFGLGETHHGLLVHPGPAAFALDPGVNDGSYELEVRVYGLDGMHELPGQRVRVRRLLRPVPALAAPSLTVQSSGSGSLSVAAAAGGTGGEVSWLLDAGHGGSWSAFSPPGVLQVGPLAPGRYELRLRARRNANAAGRWGEAPRPDGLRIVVDPTGTVSVQR